MPPLAPGLLVGAPIGLAEHRRRTGGPRRLWLTLSPRLFLAALADPATFQALVTEGIGGGIRFVSGTDAGIAPPKAHGLFAHAVIELAKVLTVPEVLATATSGAAEVCGLARSKGRLRTGYDADVLVVEGDLSEDVTALRRVRQVVVRGAVSAG